MALAHSPSIVASGLVLCVDAANPNSFGSGVPNSSLSTVEVLVVAGGGAGGAPENNTNGGGGGGGGAGGVVYSATFPVAASTAYPVVQGAGGLSNSISQGYGGNGGNSTFGTLVAIGGGGGGGGDLEGAAGLVPASPGGSGGGAGGDVTTENQAPGTAGQGNAGGARGGANNNRAGAGGGGAGQAGTSGARGINNTGRGGPGGNGISYDISGTATFYGGGGGGGACQNGSTGVQISAGGLGGGGSGAGDAAATQGTAFTGGGGGGGYGAFGLSGAAGGSGIVIVRYPGAQQASGGTITSVNNNTIHRFETSGTFTTLSSAAWRDISGRSNNGVCINSPTFSAANGGTLTFTSINSNFVNFGNILDNLTSLTLECWINFGTQTSNFNGIISKTASNSAGYELRTTGFTAGTTTVEFRYNGDLAASGTFTLTNGIWYHIVGVGTSGFQGLYINGVLASSNSINTVPTATTSQLVIGKLAYADLFVNANISVARIYNTALTAGEVNQNFQALRGRYGV